MSQISFNQLLDEIPLYTQVDVTGFLSEKIVINREIERANSLKRPVNYPHHVISPELTPTLYCGSEGCNNYTYFELLPDSQSHINLETPSIHRVLYRCCNCKEKVYRFFLQITSTVNENADNNTIFQIQKVGQLPRPGKPVPRKALKLIGKTRDLFFKGALSENQGLGIGAFSYYRRVIDSQKDKIFDEVIKVLKLTQGNDSLIQELESAKAETQFTKAVDSIKTALPDSLNLNGNNPLKLLYSALSEGLHSHTDEECLELAQDIKVVLFEFSERLDSALKENSALIGAIGRLAKISQK
jgi:hypothetical protein